MISSVPSDASMDQTTSELDAATPEPLVDVRRLPDVDIVKPAFHPIDWVLTIEGAFDPSIAAIPGGGFAVSMGFTGTTIVGGNTFTSNGKSDPLLIGLTEAGVVTWTYRLAAPGWDYFSSVAIGSDGSFYVGGVVDGGITIGSTIIPAGKLPVGFMTKLDAMTRAPIWTTHYDLPNSPGKYGVQWPVAALNGVEVDVFGGIDVGATVGAPVRTNDGMGSTITSSPSDYYQGFITGLDASNGRWLWDDVLGAVSNTFDYHAGGLIAAAFKSKDLLVGVADYGNDTLVDTRGHLSIGTPGGSQYASAVIFFDVQSQTATLAKAFGYSDAQHGVQSLDLAVEATGDVLVVGRANGKANFGLGAHALESNNYDAFIARINGSGITTWDKAFGVKDVYDGIRSVLALPSGDAMIVGYTHAPALLLDGLPLPASTDGAEFVVTLDTNGKAVWSTGPVGKVSHGPIALGEKGEVAIGGTAHGDADFGKGTMKMTNPTAYVFGVTP